MNIEIFCFSIERSFFKTYPNIIKKILIITSNSFILFPQHFSITHQIMTFSVKMHAVHHHGHEVAVWLYITTIFTAESDVLWHTHELIA